MSQQNESYVLTYLFCIVKPKIKQQLLKYIASDKDIHYMTEIIFNFVFGNISTEDKGIITQAKHHKKDLLVLLNKQTKNTQRKKILLKLHRLITEILLLHLGRTLNSGKGIHIKDNNVSQDDTNTLLEIQATEAGSAGEDE